MKLFLLCLVFIADKRAVQSTDSELFSFEIRTDSENTGEIGSIVLGKGNT